MKNLVYKTPKKLFTFFERKQTSTTTDKSYGFNWFKPYRVRSSLQQTKKL